MKWVLDEGWLGVMLVLSERLVLCEVRSGDVGFWGDEFERGEMRLVLCRSSGVGFGWDEFWWRRVLGEVGFDGGGFWGRWALGEVGFWEMSLCRGGF